MADAVKVANPAPLGLAGFGMTTILLSTMNAGFLKPDAVSVVVPLAFAFGGLGQLLTGYLEFKNGDTFGVLAFSSYGAFWWWYALLLWTVGAGWIKAPSDKAIGVVLLLWGVFSLYIWIAALRLNLTIWLILMGAWITLFTLAAGNLGLGPWCIKLGGWFGLVLGAGAMYLSFVEVTNATFGRVVIPTGGPVLKG